MINADKLIRGIVEQIPMISYKNLNNKPQYGSGNRKELNKYLELKKEDSYPLIWFMNESSDENHLDHGDRVQVDCFFVIATRETDKTLFNNDRYNLSFENILHPTTSYLLEGLTIANNSFIINDEWSVRRYGDYSETELLKEGDANYTIDQWDAVKLTCRVEFNDNCIKPIIWQSR